MINIQDEAMKIHHQYGTSEMANYKLQLLAEQYAKEYHENEVKKLRLQNVSKQSELLCGFFEPVNDSSLATICKHCGREKWMHQKAT